MANYWNSTFKVKPRAGKEKSVGLKRHKSKKRYRPKPKSQEIKDHFQAVIELGPPPGMEGEGQLTIHHCHSGSMSDNGINRGVGQRPSDWLVIALPMELHVMSGLAIDGSIGIRTWEEKFGTQFNALIWVCHQLKIDVFEKAGVVFHELPPEIKEMRYWL